MSKKNRNKTLLLITTITLFFLFIFFMCFIYYNVTSPKEIPLNIITESLGCLGIGIFFAFIYYCSLCMEEFYPKEYKKMFYYEEYKKIMEKTGKINEKDLKRITTNEILLNKQDIKIKNNLIKIAIEDSTVYDKLLELFLIVFFLIIFVSIVPVYDIIVKTPINARDNNLYIILYSSVFIIVSILSVFRLPQILREKNKSELSKEILSKIFGLFYRDKQSIIIPSIHKAETIEWTTEKNSTGAYSKVQRLFKLTIIGECVFSDWTNVKYIKIPDTIKQIKKNAFSGCTSLENLIVPDSVTKIEENAFLDVPNVTYNGIATGYPWGAIAINGKVIS